MSGPDDLHYLRTIKRRLKQMRDLASGQPWSLGAEALADEIDWLDCYIDRIERQTK